MTLAWGLLLGIGLLLVTSPLLWPGGGGAASSGRPSLAARAREMLTQAGLARVGIATVAVVSVVLGVAASALVFALVPVIAIAGASGALVLALPTAIILWRARAMRRATRVVWPDVVDHLVSAVRSGLALPDSVVTLAASGRAHSRTASIASRIGSPIRSRIASSRLCGCRAKWVEMS
jgi:tight adherence protein B